MEAVTFSVKMKPIPWARPKGTTRRYDSQVQDKAAFAVLAISNLRQRYGESIIQPGRPVFAKGVCLSAQIVFGYKTTGTSNTELNKTLLKHDCDNLCKFVLDACQSNSLSKVLWDDDKQIVSLTALQVCSDTDFISCCFIMVKPQFLEGNMYV